MSPCRCRFKTLTDVNSNHFTLFHSGSRWLSFLLDFIAALMTLFVALFVVLSDNEVISPSLKGLALSYTIQVCPSLSQPECVYVCCVHGHAAGVLTVCVAAVFQLTGMLQYVVRMGTELEARFNSVERLLEYTKVTTAAATDPCWPALLLHNYC